MLHGLAMETSSPWLVAGDFNEIKSPRKQKGGRGANGTRCRVFNEWIQKCNFIDMDTKGPFFTWKGPKWDGMDIMFKRLDRCLCNVSWLEMYEDAEIRIIPRVGSDHHPMLVKLKKEPVNAGTRTFRYEAAWQMHNEFKDFMLAVWKEEKGFNEMLESLQQTLRSWNREVFGKIEYRKRRILNRLNGIQQGLASHHNPFLIRYAKEVQCAKLEFGRTMGSRRETFISWADG
ncbi:hypothetical protein K1719_014726 [Acacia pycnantha]|nr:hypothetical protein K1719_014726 [Acacia pycnantha]